MKLTRIETFHVAPRWTFVRAECDDGAVGWGEVGIQSHRPSVAAAVSTLATQLVGEDPRQHQAHWQRLHRSGFYRGGPVLAAALAGIDIALWDLSARALGSPIHELLGGQVRERLAAYVWLGNDLSDDPPDVVAQEAVQRRAEGVRAFKLTLQSLPAVGYADLIEATAQQMAAVQAAVGAGCDVAIDCHGRADRRQAGALIARLAPLAPLFVEEPVAPDDLGALSDLCAMSHVPIAAGERGFDRHESWRLVEAGVSVLQPDIAQAGGISETWRIATVASLRGARLAPHCAIGPIALAASVQLGFACPEVIIQEDPAMPGERAMFDSYLHDPRVLQLRDGYFARPRGPGLGIEVDEAAVRAAAAEPAYFPPVGRHADGSYAEW